MENKELIFLGANIKAQNILNVDEEYFTDQELKQFVIDTKNLLNGAKSDPGLQKILDKIKKCFVRGNRMFLCMQLNNYVVIKY